jgi:hypothetical protein
VARVVGKKNRQMDAFDQHLVSDACRSARIRWPMTRSRGASGSRRRQPVALPLDCPVTFAGGFPQTIDIRNFDVAAAVVDDARLPKCMRHDRNRVTPRADHLRQEFLGQPQPFAVAQIARATAGVTSALRPTVRHCMPRIAGRARTGPIALVNDTPLSRAAETPADRRNPTACLCEGLTIIATAPL